MNAINFFDGQLITDANSVINKNKEKYSRFELVRFAEAYHAAKLKLLNIADVNNRYFKCRKCGHKVATLNPFALAVCVQPMSYRTGGICGGEYLEITKGEFNGC